MARTFRIALGLVGGLLAGLLGVPQPAVQAVSAAPVAPPFRVNACGNYSDRVLLTYDDWPYTDPLKLKRVTRWASRNNVGLELFPIGENAQAYKKATGRNLVRYARGHGMYVGNHTYDHPDLSTLGKARIRYQIKHGVSSTLLRPPYGAYNPRVTKVASNLGYRLCIWDVDTRDWTGKTAKQVRRFVLKHTGKGDTVLMHMNHNAFNVATLKSIVHGLHNKGLKICRPYRVKGKIATTPTKLPRVLPC